MSVKVNRFEKGIENMKVEQRNNLMLKENIVDKQIEKTVDKQIADTVDKQIEDTVLKAQPNVNVGENILNSILKKKEKGANHTIYLSSRVGKELIKFAKKSGQSKSEIVNSILDKIFFGENN